MLADKEMFSMVEDVLMKNGKLKAFEEEYGKVKGRMMIMRTEIPKGIDIREIEGRSPQAFEASFDFYDCIVGVALYTDTKKVASDIWIKPQNASAEEPDQAWVEFFIEKLLESIESDGSYSYPIYSFVNDTCDMTIVPDVMPEEGIQKRDWIDELIDKEDVGNE